MPVDANGTPSAKLGIYKYNTAGDAPSGKGLNNIVDSLDDIISRLGISGLVANDVPVYDSVAGKWKKAGGTPSSSTFLRGDGTWASVGAIKTTSAYSGGPPASPSDGDLWLATDAMAAGNDWLFRYRSADTYWHFIGGSYVQQTPAVAASFTTSAVRIATVAVRPGDWNLRAQAVYTSGTSCSPWMQLVRDNRATDIASSDISFTNTALVTSPVAFHSERTLSSVTTSLDVWASTDTGTIVPSNFAMYIQPIRIQ